jgi:hypothetical protein
MWEYHVNHGTSLVRSSQEPNGRPNATTNLDFLFYDAPYVELPRLLRGMEISEPTLEENERAANAAGTWMDAKSQVRTIISKGRSYVVVASHFKGEENTSEIMESPFKPRFRSLGVASGRSHACGGGDPLTAAGSSRVVTHESFDRLGSSRANTNPSSVVAYSYHLWSRIASIKIAIGPLQWT